MIGDATTHKSHGSGARCAVAPVARVASGGLVLLIVTIATLLGAVPGAGAASADTTTGATNAAPISASTAKSHAVALYGALQRNYYVWSKELYKGTPTNQCATYSCLWPFTNATAGTVFLYATPGESRYLTDTTARFAGLAHYANVAEVSPTGTPQPPAYQSAVPPPLGPGGASYYDDNAWVGLDLLHAYLATSNAQYLTLAQDEFNYVVTGWDTSATDGCPGGVFWEDVAGSQRNATANGANAELGAELDLLTNNPTDLSWATRMYQWTVTCLGTPSGLYDDHVNPDGSINTTTWSYNQGVMVGAGVLLAKATGTTSYLAQAEQTANAAVAYFGSGTTLDNQGPAFNAIYFRDLFLLNQQVANPAYASEAQAFAVTMWSQRQLSGLIDPQYGVNGTAPMVEINALLAGSAPTP
jgi:hypothetical protein